MNELRSTSTGLASSTLPLTLILVRCDQLVRAPHSHATTVHGDSKITVQFSNGFFFFFLNRVIAKTSKVRSRITRDACISLQRLQICYNTIQILHYMSHPVNALYRVTSAESLQRTFYLTNETLHHLKNSSAEIMLLTCLGTVGYR
jgi:hypothetical protein